MCAVEPGEALGGVVGRVPGGVPGTSVVVSTSWQNTPNNQPCLPIPIT